MSSLLGSNNTLTKQLGRLSGLLLGALLVSAPVRGAGLGDPFGTDANTTPSRLGALAHAGVAQPCDFGADNAPLSIADVVDRVLCRNPQSREVWANARAQAAQVGVAGAAYLPSLNGSAGVSENRVTGGSGLVQRSRYRQTSAALDLSWLIYDFGGRAANLESARQLLSAANATQDSTLQNLLLAAVQGYYQVTATQAALASAREAERATLESLKAATARYQAGVGIPADRLQAQTAYSQAMLNRIRAEGDFKTAQGALANLMGVDPTHAFTLSEAPQHPAYAQFEANVTALIDTARRRRPDLAAAQAQYNAAQANIAAARASGRPSISFGASRSYLNNQFNDPQGTWSAGVNVSIPLFSGFATTYKVRAATEQANASEALRDKLRLQVALDVWNAYQNLRTETQAVRSSADLVASAAQNADVALGRFKAGVGTILDVVTAQSALASAHAQAIQADYNWNVARVALAQAMGTLDFTALNNAQQPAVTQHLPENAP